MNSHAMLRLFHDLGVEVNVDTRKRLVTCPFHDDTHPSLTIDPAQGWHCFGCNRGGGAVALRDLIRNLTDEEVEAVAQRTGTPIARLFALRKQLQGRDGRGFNTVVPKHRDRTP